MLKIGSGEILFFNKKKDLGMIEGENNKLYFFNPHSIKDAIISEGVKVTFSIKDGLTDGHLTAYNIRIA